MPLFVKSDEVNDKADQLAALTGKSKSAAVSDALDAALASTKQNLGPLHDLKILQADVWDFIERKVDF